MPVVRPEPCPHLPASSPQRPFLRDVEERVEQRAAGTGRDPRRVEHRREASAGERAHVGHRHHADDLAARRLGDVDVVAQIGQRAAIETLDARLAAAGDQPMEALEVVTPAAPHPEAALEHPSRRHPARGL